MRAAVVGPAADAGAVAEQARRRLPVRPRRHQQVSCLFTFSYLFTFAHFGPDVTNRFLQRNGLKYVVRSHEVKNMGYEVAHNGKCITVGFVETELVGCPSDLYFVS